MHLNLPTFWNHISLCRRMTLAEAFFSGRMHPSAASCHPYCWWSTFRFSSCRCVSWYWQKKLLQLDKHFLKRHKFHKIFNWNNIKVKYGSSTNISAMIKSHNKKILSNDKLKSSKCVCNCRDNPLNGSSLQQNVIYCSNVIPRKQFTNKKAFPLHWVNREFF